MAIGDDALAAGMPLVSSSADVRKGYEQHNQTRDLIANPPQKPYTVGRFVGNTQDVGDPVPGAVAINHGLGDVPSSVQLTDRNSGAAPETRKIVVSTFNSTQIQVVVYNSGTLLVNNPVEFEWMAIR